MPSIEKQTRGSPRGPRIVWPRQVDRPGCAPRAWAPARKKFLKPKKVFKKRCKKNGGGLQLPNQPGPRAPHSPLKFSTKASAPRRGARAKVLNFGERAPAFFNTPLGHVPCTAPAHAPRPRLPLAPRGALHLLGPQRPPPVQAPPPLPFFSAALFKNFFRLQKLFS